MSNDVITYNNKGEATGFSGKGAVDLYRAAVLSSSLGLFKSGMRMRQMSGRQALDECTKYTGIKYKRGEYDKAKADMQAYVVSVKATIPTETR